MVTNQGHSKCCDLIWRYVYISVLSLALATNTTTLTLFILMVLVGLVFYYVFQCITRKFFPGLVWSCFVLLFSIPNTKISKQYWTLGILGIEIQNFKFGNSRFIFGTETEREKASPEWRDWVGTGKRMFPNVQDITFPNFFTGNIRFPGNGIRECRPLGPGIRLAHILRIGL